MKSKLSITLVLIVALVIGFLFGRFHAFACWDRFFADYVRAHESLEAEQSVIVLTELREGRQGQALNALETRLDGSLMEFLRYQKVPPKRRDVVVLRAIHAARDYRAKYPWSSSSSGVNQGVQTVLSFAN